MSSLSNNNLKKKNIKKSFAIYTYKDHINTASNKNINAFLTQPVSFVKLKSIKYRNQ